MGWEFQPTPVLNMYGPNLKVDSGRDLLTPLLTMRLDRSANRMTEHLGEAVGLSSSTPLPTLPHAVREKPWSALPAQGLGSRALWRMLRRILADLPETQAEVVAASKWLPIVSASEVRPDMLPLSPIRAAEELKAWTGLTWTQLAAAVGVHEGTLHYWKRVPHASPRPSTVTALYEAHSLTRAARAQLGENRLHAWLRRASNGPSPAEALSTGDLLSFRAQVEELAFGSAEARTPGAPPPENALTDPPEPSATVSAPSHGLRRAARPRPRAQLS